MGRTGSGHKTTGAGGHHHAGSSASHHVELDAWKKSLIEEAEKIALDEFPQRALEFNQMLKSADFQYDQLDKVVAEGSLNIPVPEATIPLVNGKHAPKLEDDKAAHEDEPTTKKRRLSATNNAHSKGVTPATGFPHGEVPCNAALAELMEKVRPKLRESVEAVNKVKMWIILLIPRIEDGNNFGVEIQEETLNEVRNVESESASFLDQMSRYFINRARLVTKVAKYPQVADYRRAIADMDEKQFINIRLVLTEMRNHFTTLHDMITKNLEKIKRPRNSNAEAMMY